MSLYEKSSLVLIPSGTKTGTVFSQKPVNGDGDFTFTRASAATRVGADGFIEKETSNLLLQSNQFDTTWTDFGNPTLTSGQSGYDGTNDAWLFQNNGSDYIRQDASSGLATFSIYAKANTGDFIYLFADGVGGRYFNLNSGTLGTEVLTNLIESKIESVGNGWYRCIIVVPSFTRIRMYASLIDGDISSVANIYIQDAQLNQGLVAQPYQETTTTAVYGGITDNTPRLDYTDSSCPALLLEPLRTNLITQSEYYGVYAPTRVTLTSNYGISPEGVQNAAAIFNTTENGRHNLNGAYFAVTSGTSYVNSVFAKAGTITKIKLRLYSGGGTSIGFNDGDFDLTNGTATGTGAGIESYGNGWYRCYVVDSPTSSVSNARFNLELLDANGGISYVGSVTDYIEIYGSDISAGSYATSYIPTYGTSVTRIAEDVELPSLNSVFDSSGDYTILFEVERLSDVNESQFIYLRSSIFNYITLSATTLGRCEIVLYDAPTGASAVTPNNSFIPNSSIKIAIRISGNTCSAFLNGSELTLNNTSVTPRNFDRYQKNQNHKKHQEVYFPTALSDAELTTLTTI